VPGHSYLLHDLEEEREDRAKLRQELKDLRLERDGWLARFHIDPTDEKAVQRLRDDIVGFNRFKGRGRSGHLRVNDGMESMTQEHYEAKLATKKAELRELLPRYAKALEVVEAARLEQRLRDAGLSSIHRKREEARNATRAALATFDEVQA
jgi:hypothetical protein